ncbi:hypothetical protein [Paenibacillus pinistramenti]|uniref:hypothetical protein n=1 Tax=Paenibacillus pinistramenti TaxID=1768003 RepID=UPI0013969846|nr:hypothetical protein [Paenibacillus pinistramenti]
MQPNRNVISKILFWIGIIILAFGFVSGFAAGGAAEESRSGFDLGATLTIWASTMIPGFLIIGFSEVIRLLQDVRDVVIRTRRRRNVDPPLNESHEYSPAGGGSASDPLPRYDREADEANREPDMPKPFPRLSRENLFPEGERAFKFHKLIKRINALEFYLEVEDRVTLEEKLGEVKRLYFEVKHLVFTLGLEDDPVWLNVVESVKFVEEELTRLNKQDTRAYG